MMGNFALEVAKIEKAQPSFYDLPKDLMLYFTDTTNLYFSRKF